MAYDHDETHKLCAQPPAVSIALPAGLSAKRESAIRLVKNKWVNGTQLHYHFLESPLWKWTDQQKAVVRWAFDRWKGLDIGLSFAEVDDPSEAELRIGFDQTDGSWSYVGTDVLTAPPGEPTMNYGWDLTTEWGHATALHEIGHALGMPHEHQNPRAGIVWNEEAVYNAFSGQPNYWSRDKIFNNILRKIALSEVEGSNWDPTSIMHYPFARGLIQAPKPYDMGIERTLDLSDNDRIWVQRFYPGGEQAVPIRVMELKALPSDVGAQRDFVFEPSATRAYTIQTVGTSDTKIVIFEERDGQPRHMGAEDDSGLPSNGVIVAQLVKNRRYFIRARTHFVSGSAGAGLLVF